MLRLWIATHNYDSACNYELGGGGQAELGASPLENTSFSSLFNPTMRVPSRFQHENYVLVCHNFNRDRTLWHYSIDRNCAPNSCSNTTTFIWKWYTRHIFVTETTESAETFDTRE